MLSNMVNFSCYKFSPRFILFYMTLINMIIYIDRGMLASVLSMLEKGSGLGLSATEAGALGSAFMLGYIVSSPLFAHYAQYIHPMWLMILGLSVWTGSVILCFFSVEFYMLFLGRAISGVGEASFVCLAPPYILDHAPPESKTKWLSIFYVALPIGTAIGFVLGL
jgi:MFS family permease